MKAALFYGGSDIRVETVPDPEPGAGEVLIAPHATGIRGSDLHGYHRPRAAPRPPNIAGHELTGVVRAVGAGVTRFAAGERVVCEPTIPCNDCPECLSGHYNLCSTGLVHIGSPRRPGGFAELLAAPEQVVYRLPDTVGFDAGALIEVYAVAVHAGGVTPVAPGDYVAVIGSGPVGLTIAQVAAAAGARIAVLGKPDAALEVAARAVDCITINVDAEDAVAVIERWTDGRLCNVVFEAVGGAHTPLNQACRIAGYRGRICMVGGATAPVQLAAREARRREQTVSWSFCYGRRGDGAREFQVAIDLLADGKVDPTPLITHTFPLAEIGTAFQTAAGRDRFGSVKVMVHPQE